MNKAVFLDRDGTINVDKNYLYKVEDFEFLPDVIESLKKFQDLGYLLIIITNQSGIARNYYTKDDFLKLKKWLINYLNNYSIHISNIYYCPHGPDSICECRKPKLGLFEQAAKDFDIDLDSSIAIGDKERDVSICKKYGTKGFVLYSKENKRIENIDFIKGGLIQAAEIIKRGAK